MSNITKREHDKVYFVDHENNGTLLMPCDMKYKHIRLTLQELNGYEEGAKDFEEKVIIDTLKSLRKDLMERSEKLREEHSQCGRNSICNQITELNEVISILQEKVYAISPVDCDW